MHVRATLFFCSLLMGGLLGCANQAALPDTGPLPSSFDRGGAGGAGGTGGTGGAGGPEVYFPPSPDMATPFDQGPSIIDQQLSVDQDLSADRDGDGVPDELDNCPDQSNQTQLDSDEDGIGDACDAPPPPPVELDRDRDGVADEEDNCPDFPNLEQADIDQDGIGDLCEADQDNDGISDDFDPEPADPDWPGRAVSDTIYAHTAGALFALDVKTEELLEVGDFYRDGAPEQPLTQITDIAIDRAGVLYAVSFGELFCCHPQRAACRVLGYLEGSFNGLTWLPGEYFGEPQDRLVGIRNDGAWIWIDFTEGPLGFTEIGRYRDGDQSSGDAYAIDGLGTFAAVNRAGVADDVIIRVDINNGFQAEDLVVATGYTSIFGLAGWRGALFAFDESGVVLRYDFESGELRIVNEQNHPWWGAAVSTVLNANNESADQ
ncbi:MAG: thrombospondin type 3 repeat-containing protein [Myxococcota bacterium]|nr:thrombospondin type 3 repeat-containing protein [Myxococcota bacterium]